MEFTCCSISTVFTAPTTTQATYDYNIGDTTLNIALSGGDWTSDVACCTLGVDTYTILDSSSAAAPAGLFTVAGDKLSVDIYSTDVSAIGPGGKTYTVTVAPVASSSCVTVSASDAVTFTVNIVNQCEDASFTMDTAVFLAPGTPSVTYTMADAQ